MAKITQTTFHYTDKSWEEIINQSVKRYNDDRAYVEGRLKKFDDFTHLFQNFISLLETIELPPTKYNWIYAYPDYGEVGVHIAYNLEHLAILDTLFGEYYELGHEVNNLKEGEDWKRLYYVREGYELPERFTIYLSATGQGSTCVLVPIETKTEVVTKVVTYDVVCPDGHPELFKTTDDGGLEYVGDNLWPSN